MVWCWRAKRNRSASLGLTAIGPAGAAATCDDRGDHGDRGDRGELELQIAMARAWPLEMTHGQRASITYRSPSTLTTARKSWMLSSEL